MSLRSTPTSCCSTPTLEQPWVSGFLGLRVVGPTGDEPEIKQVAIREAFIVVSAVVGAIPYVGDLLGQIVVIAIAWTISNSPIKQGKHDQIAGGTRVVQV